ncbi:hypothetical protein HDZ31DRAFT_62765 [Schizophyllum fasciatum]
MFSWSARGFAFEHMDYTGAVPSVHYQEIHQQSTAAAYDAYGYRFTQLVTYQTTLAYTGPYVPTDSGVHRAQSYTPPINRLPAELLMLVFARSVDCEVKEPYLAFLRSSCTPLVLARICSFWREVALATPVLWQQFALRPCRGVGHHYRIAQLFIERSRGHGLRVHYSEDARFGGRPVECCPCSVGLILNNIGQIITLQLREIRSATAARLAAVQPNSAVAMRHFFLSVHEDTLPHEVARSLSRLYCSPDLRVFLWDCTVPPIDVPWSQLIALTLTQCSVDPGTFLDVVTYSPGLRDATITFNRTPLDLAPRPAIRHHALEGLSIAGVGPLDWLLNHLHLPNLLHFTLDPAMGDAPESLGWPFHDISALFEFCGRLDRGLESLAIVYSGIFRDSALLALIHLPQMSRLRLLQVVSSHVVAGNDLFMKLQPAGTLAPLLPYLEILKLECCVTTDGVISRMLQARHTQCYPLRVATLLYPEHYDVSHPVDMHAFERLRKRGIAILWESSLGD